MYVLYPLDIDASIGMRDIFIAKSSGCRPCRNLFQKIQVVQAIGQGVAAGRGAVEVELAFMGHGPHMARVNQVPGPVAGIIIIKACSGDIGAGERAAIEHVDGAYLYLCRQGHELPGIICQAQRSPAGDDQQRAYILADNKLAENAGWDRSLLRLELYDLKNEGFDLGLTGFSDEELDALLDVDTGSDGDDEAEETFTLTITSKDEAEIIALRKLFGIRKNAAKVEAAKVFEVLPID